MDTTTRLTVPRTLGWSYAETQITLLALRAFRFHCLRRAATLHALGRGYAAQKWRNRRDWAEQASRAVKP